MNKKLIKTSIEEIANYWKKNNTISETQLNFDWFDAHTHCWNCGDNKYSESDRVRLERAHIIPESLGGDDIPSNYVLLCRECHRQAPNTCDKENMWDWIKDNKKSISFYDTYRFQEVISILELKEDFIFIEKVKDINLFEKLLAIEFEKVSWHAFEKYNISTLYFLLKNLIKQNENKLYGKTDY
jgi:hypothetical protein